MVFRNLAQWSLGLLVFSSPGLYAATELRPDMVHVADAHKSQAYVKDGLVIGGDRAIDQVIIKDIRWATKPGFERVVLDIQGNLNGEPAAVSRPPYYQLSVTPDEKRLILTVWGHPKLAFDSKRVQKEFVKSKLFSGVKLYPIVEESSWTMVFEMNSGHPVEVFELGDPVRLIIDIKSGIAHR